MTITWRKAAMRRDVGDEPVRPAPFQAARAAQARVLLEDYVELIADLLQPADPFDRGEAGPPGGDEGPGEAGGHGSVGPSRIARRLGVSHASAIKCIGRLCRAGLAETRPYRGVSLTEAGEAMAATVRRRHRIVLDLLVTLGVPTEAARADAEGIEHHVSSATLDAFERFLAAEDAKRSS